jgi:hypothetical protein
MNIGITGASGVIGRHLSDLALRRGHEVIAFSRTPRDPLRAIPGCEMRLFTTENAPDVEGCDALVHLAGESVLGIWTAAKKRRIAESRVEGTRRLAEAIARMKQPLEVLVSSSAIGIYPDAGDVPVLENSTLGDGFLAQTGKSWEHEALQAKADRVVLLRTGIVLAKHGGALPLMARAFRLGLGGRLGPGTQWMSWIHIDDLARLILFCIENRDVRGPVNGTAPWPVRNAEFTQTLAARVHRPALAPVPAFALRWLGEFSNELLGSKRVLPGVATEHGFPFRFPELAGALADLL